MKRSEMIQVIMNGALDYNPYSPVNEMQASVILEWMEDAGMLPPHLQSNRIYYDWLQRDHGWEPESAE